MSYKSTEIEQKYVHDVYDEIACHWHQTRARYCTYWPLVLDFINSLPKYSIVADVGTGDNKYMDYRKDIFMIGSDHSLPLLKINKNKEVHTCNALNIPYRNNSVDATMCIALLHHLSSIENRLRVLSELIRITRIGGSIYIYVWAFEQEKNSRVSQEKFKSQDEFVPFHLQAKFIKSFENIKNINELEYNKKQKLLVFKRYCHLFKKNELEDLVLKFSNVKIIDNGYNKGNWYVKIEKLN